MINLYAQAALIEAIEKAIEARNRMDDATKYSREWRTACEDLEFWTNKKANLTAMLEAA